VIPTGGRQVCIQNTSMEFAIAAKTVGVRPITGAELTLDDGRT
jgi:hypothetical protein